MLGTEFYNKKVVANVDIAKNTKTVFYHFLVVKALSFLFKTWYNDG